MFLAKRHHVKDFIRLNVHRLNIYTLFGEKPLSGLVLSVWSGFLNLQGPQSSSLRVLPYRSFSYRDGDEQTAAKGLHPCMMLFSIIVLLCVLVFFPLAPS